VEPANDGGQHPIRRDGPDAEAVLASGPTYRKTGRFGMTDTKSVADAAVTTFNDHDEEAIRALYAENAVFEAPGDLHVEGRDACTEHVMVWQRAFPDATLTVHNEVIAGDTAVHEFTFDGTQTDTLSSPSGHTPATN